MLRQENRFGRFSVATQILDQWEKLMPLFGQMVVTRAECNYQTQTMDYVAFSPLFKPIPLGVAAPEYHITCRRIEAEDGTVSYTFGAEMACRDDLVLPLNSVDSRVLAQAGGLP